LTEISGVPATSGGYLLVNSAKIVILAYEQADVLLTEPDKLFPLESESRFGAVLGRRAPAATYNTLGFHRSHPHINLQDFFDIRGISPFGTEYALSSEGETYFPPGAAVNNTLVIKITGGSFLATNAGKRRSAVRLVPSPLRFDMSRPSPSR
jgi:hypothetical protein